METVGPPLDDDEPHLLTEWGDPASRGRSGVAGAASVFLHIAGVILIVLLPSNLLSPPPARARAAATGGYWAAVRSVSRRRCGGIPKLRPRPRSGRGKRGRPTRSEGAVHRHRVVALRSPSINQGFGDNFGVLPNFIKNRQSSR